MMRTPAARTPFSRQFAGRRLLMCLSLLSILTASAGCSLRTYANLMPPMGENLFLSSYRFERPLAEVYRSTLPYSVIVLAVVLLITYVPGLTLWLVHLLEGRGML